MVLRPRQVQPIDAAKAKQQVTELGTSAVWRVAMRDAQDGNGRGYIAVRDDNCRPAHEESIPCSPSVRSYDQC